MNERVSLSDIVLKSVNASWYNSFRKKCSEEDFKMYLKVTHLSYDHARELYGSDSNATKLAKQKLDYLMNQIDKDESDLFALMMFKTSDWDL